jgi:hypothetical protein
LTWSWAWALLTGSGMVPGHPLPQSCSPAPCIPECYCILAWCVCFSLCKLAVLWTIQATVSFIITLKTKIVRKNSNDRVVVEYFITKMFTPTFFPVILRDYLTLSSLMACSFSYVIIKLHFILKLAYSVTNTSIQREGGRKHPGSSRSVA